MDNVINCLETHHQHVELTQTKLFIDGEFTDSSTLETFESISPVTEKTICSIALAGSEDVERAVIAANKALEGPWREMDASSRGKLLFKLADLIDEHQLELAKLETLDSGKPLSSTKGEISECADVFRYYAGWADKIEGSTISINGPYHCRVEKEPVGVCGLIIPWNYPLSMATWKLAPCLAAGCTALLKPAEQTSLTALKLAELLKTAGFPKGVVNVLTGLGKDSTGAFIVNHPGINKIAFTGEGATAAIIKRQCAESSKRLSFELGGKSPNIIFADCEFEAALNGSVNAIFSNMGQNCCAGSRTFIERPLYEKFVSAFALLAKRIKLGCPFDDTTSYSAQIDKAQFDKIMNYIEIGKKEGAKCISGGKRFGETGYFVEPTVFCEVTNQMRIAQEEIFGPVACLIPFETEEEVIKLANDTPFGLASAVWTKDLSRSERFISKLKAGTVWVNCYNVIDYHAPFGGFKGSGTGRELGKNALDLYLETKTVTRKI